MQRIIFSTGFKDLSIHRAVNFFSTSIRSLIKSILPYFSLLSLDAKSLKGRVTIVASALLVFKVINFFIAKRTKTEPVNNTKTESVNDLDQAFINIKKFKKYITTHFTRINPPEQVWQLFSDPSSLNTPKVFWESNNLMFIGFRVEMTYLPSKDSSSMKLPGNSMCIFYQTDPSTQQWTLMGPDLNGKMLNSIINPSQETALLSNSDIAKADKNASNLALQLFFKQLSSGSCVIYSDGDRYIFTLA